MKRKDRVDKGQRPITSFLFTKPASEKPGSSIGLPPGQPLHQSSKKRPRTAGGSAHSAQEVARAPSPAQEGEALAPSPPQAAPEPTAAAGAEGTDDLPSSSGRPPAPVRSGAAIPPRDAARHAQMQRKLVGWGATATGREAGALAGRGGDALSAGTGKLTPLEQQAR
jgi:hypothetical protein